MASNARKGSPPKDSTKGITTMRTSKTRVFVFLTLFILTAYFAAGFFVNSSKNTEPQQQTLGEIKSGK